VYLDIAWAYVACFCYRDKENCPTTYALDIIHFLGVHGGLSPRIIEGKSQPIFDYILQCSSNLPIVV
jgi:hypothetical protein